jgi:hypothetical protein
VRPRHVPFTVTPARFGVEVTTRRPRVAVAGAGRDALAADAGVSFGTGGGTDGRAAVVGGGVTFCSLY